MGPTAEEMMAAFEERMRKRQAEEDAAKAKADAEEEERVRILRERTVEGLRHSYLARTGRREMKP